MRVVQQFGGNSTIKQLTFAAPPPACNVCSLYHVLGNTDP